MRDGGGRDHIAIRGRAKHMRTGARYTLIGPSGLVTIGKLFGVLENGTAKYVVLRVDRRGLKG